MRYMCVCYRYMLTLAHLRTYIQLDYKSYVSAETFDSDIFFSDTFFSDTLFTVFFSFACFVLAWLCCSFTSFTLSAAGPASFCGFFVYLRFNSILFFIFLSPIAFLRLPLRLRLRFHLNLCQFGFMGLTDPLIAFFSGIVGLAILFFLPSDLLLLALVSFLISPVFLLLLSLGLYVVLLLLHIFDFHGITSLLSTSLAIPSATSTRSSSSPPAPATNTIFIVECVELAHYITSGTHDHLILL
mmetsp:Transcript_4743/g.8610  ORF Transcript_4743/g.8610 Transcript_4743/m.8610 type:complete len:242 (+) Transcript_4743:84-809(+)